MGSDESHFNVSLLVKNKVTKQFPQTTTFLKRKESQCRIELRSFWRERRANAELNWGLFEEKGEPMQNWTEVFSAYQPNALPLGQTGSQRFAVGAGYLSTERWLRGLCKWGPGQMTRLKSSSVFCHLEGLQDKQDISSKDVLLFKF